MAVATKNKLPTASQLKEYADELPEIYRLILEAFPKLIPDRREGQYILIGSLGSLLKENGISSEEIAYAAKNLKADGFIEFVLDLKAVKPTKIGEELITAITGISPRKISVPALPKKKW